MPEDSSLLDLMPAEAMLLSAHANDCRDALRVCGEALSRGGITKPEYTEEMINTFDELGAYFVVSPGFALAHSRPSPSVIKTGLSWVSLDTPVDFGSKRNDPVRVVVGLAALDHQEHITAMAQLARLVSDRDLFDHLMSLDDIETVRNEIRNHERKSK